MRSAARRLREALRRNGLLGTLRLVGHTLASMIEERSPARRREWQRQLEFDTQY
jgi:uncharacterized protein with von Willebrand factor type A (vWA) domain